jgi:carbamoyl-phosphate synthase large subunit
VLKKYNVELLGASVEAIKKAEDREIFKNLMIQIGAQVPLSKTVKSVAEGLQAVNEIGYPGVIRNDWARHGGRAPHFKYFFRSV